MKNGFSLVELSIVLVILGLLVGGIMTGQNLIKAAELRSVTTEFQAYQTSVNLFKEKYFALPGDMRNAGQFWEYADTSSPDGGCGTPLTDGGTGTETCDGDGDGQIEDNHEMFRFWQHLANAGLVTGNYTGVQGSTAWHHILGENAPVAKFSNGAWGTWASFNFGGSTEAFAYDYRNQLHIGSPRTNERPRDPLFTPEEVWNIDTKVDDGKPGKGIVVVRYWNDCTGATGFTETDADNAVYLLQNSNVACAIFFADVF